MLRRICNSVFSTFQVHGNNLRSKFAAHRGKTIAKQHDAIANVGARHHDAIAMKKLGGLGHDFATKIGEGSIDVVTKLCEIRKAIGAKMFGYGTNTAANLGANVEAFYRLPAIIRLNTQVTTTSNNPAYQLTGMILMPFAILELGKKYVFGEPQQEEQKKNLQLIYAATKFDNVVEEQKKMNLQLMNAAGKVDNAVEKVDKLVEKVEKVIELIKEVVEENKNTLSHIYEAIAKQASTSAPSNGGQAPSNGGPEA